jgi:nitrogen fixation protein NifX
VIKVAFTSTDGRAVDEHFGTATGFYVWHIEPARATCRGKVMAPPAADEDEDKILARAQALEGCTIVCTGEIGGPAAAKLVSRHIHPMKMKMGTSVQEVVLRLQSVLNGQPPPWLRKAMGDSRGAVAPEKQGDA